MHVERDDAGPNSRVKNKTRANDEFFLIIGNTGSSVLPAARTDCDRRILDLYWPSSRSAALGSQATLVHFWLGPHQQVAEGLNIDLRGREQGSASKERRTSGSRP